MESQHPNQMRFNSKSDRDLAFEQSFLRYNIIKKSYLRFRKKSCHRHKRNSRRVGEMSELVEQLTNGQVVADLVAHAFLDDIALHWESF